jgi:hypothetical protein
MWRPGAPPLPSPCCRTTTASSSAALLRSAASALPPLAPAGPAPATAAAQEHPCGGNGLNPPGCIPLASALHSHPAALHLSRSRRRCSLSTPPSQPDPQCGSLIPPHVGAPPSRPALTLGELRPGQLRGGCAVLRSQLAPPPADLRTLRDCALSIRSQSAAMLAEGWHAAVQCGRAAAHTRAASHRLGEQLVARQAQRQRIGGAKGRPEARYQLLG